MIRKLRIVALALLAGFGIWLAFHEPLPGTGLVSSWNCAASRAIICIQKGK
jgi:hypothetical protein